ncbi:MAG: cadherin-like beta sandwich domain-containing protein [Prevotellaceae bacterium]|jgi:hypothetical protein|nr:cadherin-like beta sandwich domain-containing protein [Prevotellaceae bacterium]
MKGYLIEFTSVSPRRFRLGTIFAALLALYAALPFSPLHARRTIGFHNDFQLKTLDDNSRGDTLAFDRFPGWKDKAVIRRVSRSYDGVTGITAELAGAERGTCFVSVSDAGVSVAVEFYGTDEQLFATGRDGQYSVSRNKAASPDDSGHVCAVCAGHACTDHDDHDDGGGGARTRSSRPATRAAGNLDESVTIDLLIVYTENARVWAENSSTVIDIDDMIDRAMQRANTVMTNSRANVHLNLVRKHRTNYAEADMHTDLSRLRNRTDGFMDEVHNLRQLHRADMVMLVTDVSSGSVAGVGYILSNADGTPESAFAVAGARYMADTYTMVHELAHNMGCGHYDANSPQRDKLFSYSAGWRGTKANGDKMATVMTYENMGDGQWFPRIPYFSDPNITFDGAAIGAADRNNALTIRQTKHAVSHYSEYIDPSLSSLSVSPGTLSPAFDPAVANYTVNVPDNTAYIDVSAAVDNADIAITSGNGRHSLSSNPAVVEIHTVNFDGATKVYKVTVSKGAALSSDATLRSLSLGNVALSPAFSANTTNYTASVANSVSSVTIAAAANHAKAKVAGAGTKTLNAGANSFSVTVTAEDGTTKTYNISVTRAAPLSSDATLRSLSLGNVALSPAFSANTTNYTASAANSVTYVTIAAAANHAKAKVAGTGSITLNVGANNFSVTVTAEDGTTKTYNISVTRAAPSLSSDATLKSLSLGNVALSPAFSANTTSYTASAANSVTSVTIAAVANHAKATVAGTGTKNLNVGTNSFSVTVTAENGTTTAAYTVTVVRDASHDNRLANFAVAEGTLVPAFDPDVTDYRLNVSCGIAEMSFTVSPPVGGSAESFVNGTKTDIADGYIVLKPGINRFLIRSRSSNGITLDYNVNVVRPFDRSLIVRYWNDVLAVNLNQKTNGGYSFDSFQWTKNGAALKGETSPYLYDAAGKLSAGDYSVQLSVGEYSVATCPLSVTGKTKSGNSLTAYPNPTSGNVIVETDALNAAPRIQLFDLNGRLLHSFPVEETQTVIDVSAYPAGIYILRHGQEALHLIKN